MGGAKEGDGRNRMPIGITSHILRPFINIQSRIYIIIRIVSYYNLTMMTKSFLAWAEVCARVKSKHPSTNFVTKTTILVTVLFFM